MSLHVVTSPEAVPRAREGTWVVGFFGAFSERARLARPAFEAFAAAHAALPVFLVDVAVVKGVHPRFGVEAVPEAVTLEGDRVVRRAAGAHAPEGWAHHLLPHAATPRADVRPVPIVYTTPTCVFCGHVKRWLAERGVTYREVDLTKDPGAAERLVAKSGQQGVPQTELGGAVVVGFDPPKLARLLGVNP